MIDVSVARLKLKAYEVVSIPKKERWMLSPPNGKGKEVELKRGFKTSAFGFASPALPNDDFKKGTEDLYPPDFNLKAWKNASVGKGDFDNITQRIKIPLKQVIPCQNYLDAYYLHHIMDDLEFLLEPVTVGQYGQYFWVVNGTHRIVAASLLDIHLNVCNSVFVEKVKTKVRKKK